MSEAQSIYAFSEGDSSSPSLSAPWSGLMPCIAEKRKPRLPETLLHAAWTRAGARSASIRGRDGRRYRVIYPGRPADGAGPDFRDAILLRDDGRRIHGDVEIHVRSNDWHSHGHGSDSAYNGVVLHVVSEIDGPPIKTPSGIHIPLLVLDRAHIDATQPMGRVHPRASTTAAPLPILDPGKAGDQWFLNRSHGYQLDFAGRGIEQTLWSGALECLGYPSNKKGFRQLADRLDWKQAKEAAVSMPISRVTELFQQAAGLGSKHSNRMANDRPVPEWKARHGRPANSPVHRLKAAPEWAARWAVHGIKESFERALREATKPSELVALFKVTGVARKVAPVGEARGRDTVVNHLLPAVHALARSRGDQFLQRKAERMFHDHPILSSNSITREAQRILRARGIEANPRTAREQQGLIHIYRMTVASQRGDSQLPLL